jgi:F0F1-type ATP synthase membrane subunit b/b'
MKFKLSLQEYEKELKQAKKKYDKLCKQYKKCRSSYQAETIAEDLEDTRQDIVELQIIINEIRQEKKLHECDPTEFVY